MKRSSLIITFLVTYFLLAFTKEMYATQPSFFESDKAFLRVGRHADFMRIVFTTSSEDISKSATVSSTDSKVLKVTFSMPIIFTFKKADTEQTISKGGGFIEIAQDVRVLAGSNFCLLRVENFKDYKLSRMNNPPRIIIDVYTISDKQILEDIKPQVKTKDTTVKMTFNNIAIDPGHGGYDKGIYDENNREKDIVLNICKEISKILTAGGKKVFLTRKSDQRISIKERISFVNARPADIFISIHISSQAEGVIYTNSEEEGLLDNLRFKKSNDLATNIISHLNKDLGINFRHEKLPLPLLKYTKAPALLIELPNFKNFSYDKKGSDAIIKSIINGITMPTITN